VLPVNWLLWGGGCRSVCNYCTVNDDFARFWKESNIWPPLASALSMMLVLTRVLFRNVKYEWQKRKVYRRKYAVSCNLCKSLYLFLRFISCYNLHHSFACLMPCVQMVMTCIFTNIPPALLCLFLIPFNVTIQKFPESDNLFSLIITQPAKVL